MACEANRLFSLASGELIRDGGSIDAAAQLAYYAVLAIFPFGVLALSLVAFLPLHGLDQQLINFVWQVMPHDVAKMMTDILHDVVGKQHGILLIVALVGAVWTASGAVSATMQSLNHTWGVKETRPYWKAKGTSLLLTVGGVVLTIVGMAALLIGTEVGHAIVAQVAGSETAAPIHHVGGALVRYGVIGIAMLAVTGLSYRVLPNVKGSRTIWPGALFSTAAWVVVSLAFGFYLSRFASYAQVYGALGTAVVLLTWLYLSSMVLVLGGAMNASFDRATAQEKKA
jgi:membrane protein